MKSVFLLHDSVPKVSFFTRCCAKVAFFMRLCTESRVLYAFLCRKSRFYHEFVPKDRFCTLSCFENYLVFFSTIFGRYTCIFSQSSDIFVFYFWIFRWNPRYPPWSDKIKSFFRDPLIKFAFIQDQMKKLRLLTMVGACESHPEIQALNWWNGRFFNARSTKFTVPSWLSKFANFPAYIGVCLDKRNKNSIFNSAI